MNCSKCGKFLGWGAAALKGKDLCKRCKEEFESKSEKDCGLLVVVTTKKVETANVYTL